MRLGVKGARSDVDQHRRLAGERLAADEPVERVLQDAGNAMSVFRRSDDQPVARLSLAAQRGDRRRQSRARFFVVGIEGGQSGEFVPDLDLDARGREQNERFERGAIDGSAPQTPAQSKQPDGAQRRFR